jgi:mono/diheme cytochrome c family protein
MAMPRSAVCLLATVALVAADPPAADYAGVQKILADRCIECHGPNKSKAGLRLDSPTAIMHGAKGKPVVVASQADQSRLLAVVLLPKGDDDRMPPKGEPLTAEQTDLIRRWIAAGAPMPAAAATPAPAPAPAPAVQPAPAIQPTMMPGAKLPADRPAAGERTLADCAAAGMVVRAIPGATGLYTVNARHLKTPFSAAESALVGALGAGVVDLSLGAGVEDRHLAVLAELPALVRLHLSGTAITDAGLTTVASRPNLELLDLGSTAITDAGLDQVAGMTGLRTLVLVGTQTTEAGVARLRAARPQLTITTSADLPAGDPASLGQGKRGGKKK